jgi:hypothetical protein
VQVSATPSSAVQGTIVRRKGLPFAVFGLPVTMSAPVIPPYGNSAFRTRGGQPENGQDEIMRQAVEDDGAFARSGGAPP